MKNDRFYRSFFIVEVISFLAGGNGFEPLQANPESAVLPLDEPPELNGWYFTILLAVCPGF
jgi:hypothetical protein